MNIKKLREKVRKQYESDIQVTMNESSIILEGEMDDWNSIVRTGYMFVDPKKKLHVVNNIRLKNHEPKPMILPKVNDKEYEGREVDVLVIGGGIIGCSILRELSRWNLKLLLIEKEADVACGASGANDGMVHPGIDLHEGLLKTKYCLEGNRLYDQVAKELDIDFERCGQYIIFSSNMEKRVVPFILRKARRMGVPGVHYLKPEEIRGVEPSIGEWAKGAIALDSTGIISPYKATIAFAENAIQNKAEVALETACLGMELQNGRIISVATNRGTVYPKLVINAAGVFSDVIAEMAGDRFFSIHPRKGTEILFDRKTKKYVNSIVARCPLFSASKTHTKGGAIVSTVDGNVLFGPNAMEVPDREAKETLPGEIDQVYERYLDVIPYFKKADIIAYFSGIRASSYEEDFIIGPGRKTFNLIHVAGIQSPGLTAAPAIATDVAQMAVDMIKRTEEVRENKDFNPFRKRIPHLSEMTPEERGRLIQANPDYGKIICRCEEVSLGEIKDAIHAPLGAQSIDAIKRRVRPGMGRCQGGFCMPHILRLLGEELHIDYTKVNRRGQDTNYGLYATKDVMFDELGESHGNI